MRVAVLGTGKMGAAMARRLASNGHELILWNRTRERAERVGVGQVAGTPAAAADGAGVVISILTNADAVRSTYAGEHGAAAVARDQVYIEMSTAGPQIAEEIAAMIEGKGAKFVECPVLGSIGAIESGKATLFAAGDDDALAAAQPILNAFGELRRIGSVAGAAALKLVANTMLMSVTALAAELLAAGTAAGADEEDLFWLLTRFVPLLAGRRAGLVEHQYEPVTFALRDALKDLNLATEMFRAAGARAPLATATTELYALAARSVGELDLAAIASMYEKPPAKRR
jgi:3-hydroxyisobutyrate dehydrogenase-like beta-hydroxyacid dehydrogenase